jgi:CyaY protein
MKKALICRDKFVKKILILQRILEGYTTIGPMDETEFHQRANRWLSMAEGVLEEADARGDLDLDSQNDALSIELPTGKTLLVSKHSTMRQLWVASPVSGGLHFSFRDGTWMLADGRTLEDVLAQELKILAGVTVHW